MAKFQELSGYINNTLLTLIGSQDLCKLLYYNSPNPLSEPDISDTYSLLFSKIYPVPKLLYAADEAGSLLTVIFDEFQLGGNVGYKNGTIVFNIISHIDTWRIDGGLRPYSIANEIDTIFNNKRIAGIGKMVFDRMRFLWVNDKFSGYTLEYKIIDFN